MKNIRIFVFSTFIIAISIISCQNQNDTLDKKVISPNGVYFSENIKELKASLFEGEYNLSDLKIIDYKFLETTKACAIEVFYQLEDGPERNIIWYKSLKKDEVSVSDYTVDCIGSPNCQDCRVQGIIHPDGRVEIQCESSCCKMEVSGISP